MPTSAWYQERIAGQQLLQGAALRCVRDARHRIQLGRVHAWKARRGRRVPADSTANSAVIAAIAPICVDQFQRSADAADNLTALKKINSWQQAACMSRKGGWAVPMPGSSKAAG